jgi:hypothetical protein
LLTWEEIRDLYGTKTGAVLVKYTLTDSGYKRSVIDTMNFQIFPHSTDYPVSVYDNRYLINILGDVYDLQKKKMIHEHIGQDIFMEKNGDSVIFRHRLYKDDNPFRNDKARHNEIKNPYYYFDLSSHHTGLFPAGSRYMIAETEKNILNNFLPVPNGVLSPDKNKLAYFLVSDTIANTDYSLRDSSLYLCGWTRVFPTYGHIIIKRSATDSVIALRSVLFNFGLWHPNSLPLLWLNDSALLTQRKNGRLIILDITTGKTTDFSALEGVFNCSYPPRFEQTVNKEILYMCPTSHGEIFKVNIAGHSLEKITELQLANNYFIKPFTPNPNWEYVAGYGFNGKTILEDTTATGHYAILDNKIAIQCKERMPTPGRYEHHWNRIRIYDPAGEKWISIRIEYLKQLVGWIKE